MATVAVSADNTRIAVATIATDAGTWGNDGGGGTVTNEPDIAYQGTTAQSRKVSTALIGRNYTDTAGVDATAADRRHFLFKLLVVNYNALNTRTTPGSQLKIGSSSSVYDHYYPYGSDNYPLAGGWVFLPISVNVAGYRTSVGSPTRTAELYYSWLGDFTATAKSENLVIDAIDLGRGLKLVGGDGASADGLFADFLLADEGTSGNRWGYLRSKLGIYFAIGELSIGENTSEAAVATVFQDTAAGTIIWENGLVETGFHKLRLNLGGTGTDIDITGWTFGSQGQKANNGDRGYTTTEDSRLVVEATGTTGAANFIGCVFTNLATATLTSAVTLDTCDMQVENMTQSGAEIFDCVIRTTSVANVGTITDPTFGVSTDIRDTEFIQEGAGHAVEVGGTSQTITVTGCTWTGYGADTTSSAAIDFTGSGTHTVNWNGGSAPTYNNSGGGTVTVQGSVTLTLKSVASGSQCAIYATDDDTQLMNEVASGGDVTETYTGSTPRDVYIRIRKSSGSPKYLPYIAAGQIIAGTGLTVTVTQIADPIAV